MCVCMCERKRERVSSHTHAGWHGHTTGKWKRNILKILLPSSAKSGKKKKMTNKEKQRQIEGHWMFADW